MQYKASIQNAIDYIEAHLTGDISLCDAAQAAHFSLPHFYRVFKALTGDTVGAYVLKRRVTLAADALCSGSRTVAEIAYAHGFESHDVFTRAFCRVYGMPPSRYRKLGGTPGFAPYVAQGIAMDGRCAEIRFELVHKAAFHVAGMRCSAVEWDTDGTIGRLWSEFLPRVEEIVQRTTPAVMYGICESEHAQTGRFSYISAVGVSPGCALPGGMAIKTIRAQWFIEALVPEVMSVPDAYTLTIRHAEENGYEVDEYDYIEHYVDEFQDPADHSFALLIPVKHS